MHTIAAPTLTREILEKVELAKHKASNVAMSVPEDWLNVDLDPAYRIAPTFSGRVPATFSSPGTRLARSDLHELGQALTPKSSTKDLVEYLHLVNAWGYGSAGYGPTRTHRVATGTEWNRFEDAARRALVILQDSSLDDAATVAYYCLSNRSESRVKGWGPAFFTKFLAFVDPTNSSSTINRAPALILDRWMAVAIRSTVDPATRRFPESGWRTPDYAFYVHLLTSLAETPQFQSAPYHGHPSNVERCLFAHYRGD